MSNITAERDDANATIGDARTKTESESAGTAVETDAASAGDDAKSIRGKRSLFLALSTFALLFLGLIYAFSMFATPISTSFGLEKDAVGLTFNIMMVAFCIGAVIGSQIEKAIGVRSTLVIAALMFLGGFVGAGLFGSGSIAAVYLCYGVLGGLAVGIGYNSVIATTNMWFPDKVGFSSGVLMMGFGLGSLILGTLAVNLIPAVGLSVVFAGIGVITCAVVIVLALLLQRPPANVTKIMAPGKETASGYDPGDEDAPLKSPTFYVYWIWAIIVIAKDPTVDNVHRGATMFLVDRDTPGVTINKLPKMGHEDAPTSICEVFLNDVRVPRSAILGVEHNGFMQTMANFTRERIANVSGVIATAVNAFEDACAYANQREQFGQQIGRFELVQEMIMEMACKIENMMNMLYKLCWQADQGQDVRILAGMAKYYCSKATCEVVDDAIQVLAGIGVVGDHRVVRYYIDIRSARIAGGSDQVMVFNTAPQILKRYR